LVIWDAGLGAGSNAMAALCCFESEWKNSTNAGLLPDRPMRLLSFEHDWIRSNCSWESAGFPLPPRRSHELLKSGMWKHSSGLLSWELIEGDFLETFETAITPDLIFYDPFSFKTDARFWTSDVFSRIFEKLSPKSAELYTYSASTAVRVALLTAGFFVAEGVGMGPKSSTTLAFSQPSGGRTSAGSCTPRPGLARALETQSFKAACRPCRRR
jgi:queuine tRNA-ribosyltransferase